MANAIRKRRLLTIRVSVETLRALDALARHLSRLNPVSRSEAARAAIERGIDEIMKEKT